MVLTTRHAYQKTMRADLVAGIEHLTGRRVIAFLSDNHIDPTSRSSRSYSPLRSEDDDRVETSTDGSAAFA